MNFLKEMRAAGLISKKLSERVVYGTEEGPAPVNPNMPQTDVNISGHSTADKPLEQEQPKAEPAPAAAPEKGQKEYLINSAMASMKAVEACLEAMCEGKCWENLSLQPDAATGMSEMLKTMKEWSAKMESWKESAVTLPANGAEPPLVQNQTLSQPAAPQPPAAPAPAAPAAAPGPVAA